MAMVEEAVELKEPKPEFGGRMPMSEFLRQKNPGSLREALAALRMAYPRESIARRINVCVAWHEQHVSH